MEIEKYLTPLFKWWWLLVVAVVLATTASFLVTSFQSPVYQSRTTIMVGKSIDNPNPSSGDVWLSQYLAGLYADFASREPLQDATRKALGIDWLPTYSARVVPNSQIIEIIVSASSPEISEVVANELARQLILFSPTSGAESQNRQTFIEQQLNALEGQIADTQANITDLQQQLPTLNSARQIADTQAKIDTLSSKLNTLQSNYASLLTSAPQGASNTLTVLEPARSGYQVPSNRMMIILIAAAVGFSLAVGAAYLMEYLDRTIKTAEDISKIFNVPVLGYIPENGTDQEKSFFVIDEPRSPTTEAIRGLRSNLEFSSVDQPLNTLLISSIGISDGKTTLAANLALSLAQSEKKILLLDADLRRPTIHKRFGIRQKPGLSDAFVKQDGLKNLTQTWQNISELGIITSGDLPPNPSELLGSQKMTKFLGELTGNFDLIIIDGPPFVVADTPILASKVDGLLLVIPPGQVKREQAILTNEQIKRSGARLIGVVFNRIRKNDFKLYPGYFYSYYPTVEEQMDKRTLKNSFVLRFNNIIQKIKSKRSSHKSR